MATGLFGSLLGLGGGVLLVPLLTLGFDLPVREAVGVSLVCVIVTSGVSAAVFLDRRVANLRLGMVLELFTAIGALIGGLSPSSSTSESWRASSRPPRLHGGDDAATATGRPVGGAGGRWRPDVRRRGPHARRPRRRRDVRSRLPGPRPHRGRGGRRWGRHHLGAAGDRRWARDGARDARPHACAAPDRHGHEQPDDRHHGLDERARLPAPRRHRRLRHRAGSDRRVRRARRSGRGSRTAWTSASCGSSSRPSSPTRPSSCFDARWVPNEGHRTRPLAGGPDRPPADGRHVLGRGPHRGRGGPDGR